MEDFYAVLSQARRAEAGSAGLARLPPGFFARLRVYRAEVEATAIKEAAADAMGQKAAMARSVASGVAAYCRDLMEGRREKMLRAVFRNVPPENIANLTDEERAILSGLPILDLSKFQALWAPPPPLNAAGQLK